MGNFAAGWRQVGLAFVLLASVSMIASAYSVIAVPLAAEFHPSRMVVGLAMTVLSAVSAVISPLLGNFMDRGLLKPMMLTGAVLLASGYAALSFVSSFNQVLVVVGLLIAPANVLLGPVAVTVLLSNWFVRRRGTAIGIAISGVGFGSVVYPPLVQFLLNGHDWREAFRWFALLLLAINLIAAALVIEKPALRGLHPDGASEDPAQRPSSGTLAISARQVLSDPSFWLMALVVAIVTSGMKGMVTNLAPMALDAGIGASEAALLVSLYGATGFAAKLSFAAISDWLGPRRIMLISLSGFAAGMACLTQAGSLGHPAIVGGIALIGLFGGFMVPVQSLVVPRIFGEGVVGKAMGLISMVTLVALLTTPPLFGRIFDVTGSYAAIFWTFCALALAALALVPAIRLHPREQAA